MPRREPRAPAPHDDSPDPGVAVTERDGAERREVRRINLPVAQVALGGIDLAVPEAVGLEPALRASLGPRVVEDHALETHLRAPSSGGERHDGLERFGDEAHATTSSGRGEGS